MQKNQKLLAKYQELHQVYSLKIKSLTFLRNYGDEREKGLSYIRSISWINFLG